MFVCLFVCFSQALIQYILEKTRKDFCFSRPSLGWGLRELECKGGIGSDSPGWREGRGVKAKQHGNLAIDVKT